MKRREKELERDRGRNLERERDTGRRGFLRVRRGSRIAKMPRTRGSRPAFKSGHEDTDAGIISASCRHERDTDAGLNSALRRYKNAKAALNRCQEREDPR